MKANELRIGNLVNYLIEDNFENPSKWYQETYIDAEDLLILSKKGCDNYQPIPLTEEWLLNFGFDKALNGYWYKDYINVKLFDIIEIYLRGDDNNLANDTLKYVHQLQNLYFALTGEELTYGGNK